MSTTTMDVLRPDIIKIGQRRYRKIQQQIETFSQDNYIRIIQYIDSSMKLIEKFQENASG